MRTKTLILTAALSAAGIATSMGADVFSVNAVGYVNTPLKPGFNLLSNPLMAADNTLPVLFAGVPNGTQVFTYGVKADGTTGFTTYTLQAGRWFGTPDAATVKIEPGQGVFVRNATAADLNVTFVGEVSQGTGATLDNPIPAGLSIKSSKVPQEGGADTLGFPAGTGDQIFKYDPAAQRYTTFTFNAGRWFNSVPVLKVGEAVFVRKTAAAIWKRDFTVN